MVKQLITYIKENDIDPYKNTFLLATSGGMDSMAMCVMFLKAEIKFEIAHYNFSLRGEESDKDERLVSDFAKKNNIAFHVQKTDTNSFAKDNKLGIQEAARVLRYRWFDELLLEQEIDFLATAHHKQDVVETMLFNFTRGGGLKALQGILPKRGKIIRPLLFTTKEEIKDFVEREKIEYREDQSNSSVKYSRNRIRHEIIPSLQKINPGLVETLSRKSKVFQQGVALIDKIIRQELEKEVIVTDAYEQLPIDYLSQSSYKNLIVWQWVEERDFGSEQVDEILGLLSSISGKKIFSPSHIIVRDRNQLILAPKPVLSSEEITYNSQEEFLESTHLNCELISGKNLNFKKDNTVSYFDSKKIEYPVTIRIWKAGDRIAILGMKGKEQKVSDILVQHKVNLIDKNKVEVLTFDNVLAWVIGFRSSESFKVDVDSDLVLKITANS